MTLRSRSRTLKFYVKVFGLKFFSTFLLWKQLRQIGGWTLVSLVTFICGSWSEGQHDPYVTVHWFCLISWRLFDVWTSHFGIMSQYDLTCDLKINVGHWPIFHGPVILPYILKSVWYMNILLRNCESVWLDVWPQNKYRSLWPIVHGPVILPYILKTIWTSYFGIMSEYDTTFDLKINVGHYDLCYMVQWFYLISWRLFDIWTPYFGIMSQYDPMFDLKIFVAHCDLHFMVQWFYLISWKLFSGWTSYFGIMSQYDPTYDLQ